MLGSHVQHGKLNKITFVIFQKWWIITQNILQNNLEQEWKLATCVVQVCDNFIHISLDHALKCSLYRGIGGKYPVICIDRPSASQSTELVSWAKTYPTLFYFLSVNADITHSISSTLVRQKLAKNESVADLVGKDVEDYLLKYVIVPK